ncbi:MAG: DNA/RNA nuclease SfsA [Chloroflexi bacterium]|nr:DNA/RNA nuclease SfsA [Chloroflexota bacterium]
MKLAAPLVSATFLRRLSRFSALADVQGHQEAVHVANSGRLRELLEPGRRVFLKAVPPRSSRRTVYDLALVDLGRTLVSADARLPPSLVHEALGSAQLPQFAGYDAILREQRFAGSRLDLVLEYPGQRCYVEVKSVTLVEGGVGLFPDAPTLRGQRHLEALAHAVAQGYRAAVVFVVQREDATAFAAHEAADPVFAGTLRRVHASGVEVYAYRCRVTMDEVTLRAELPVLWDRSVPMPVAAPSGEAALPHEPGGTLAHRALGMPEG